MHVQADAVMDNVIAKNLGQNLSDSIIDQEPYLILAFNDCC